MPIEIPLTLEEYLAVGDEGITEEPLTDEGIVRLVQGEPPVSDHESDKEEDPTTHFHLNRIYPRLGAVACNI